MSRSVSIHLPVFQRFDCHGCTYCCRSPVVAVSEQDRKRIVAAGWEDRLAGQRLFVESRAGLRQTHRLARQADGACVFLGPDNRCRLHAETGPQTKPLACRLFPFVLVPGVGSVRLDLRMACPSVAANEGRTLAVHAADLARLASESGLTRGSPKVPDWANQRDLSAAEFEAVVAAFDRLLQRTAEPVRVRLQAGSHLLDLIYAARIDKVRDDRFVELMEILAQAALDQARSSAEKAASESGMHLAARPARLFRQWLFLHTIEDTPESLAAGRIERWRQSWRRYGQARRFAAGAGRIPRVRPEWPETTFEAVDAVRPAPEEALKPLIRSLRLKLDAHAFAGPAYFGYDLLAGLTALWLVPGLVGWLGRLAAVARGTDTLGPEDVLAGVRQAHHTFGVSAVFARVSERLRMRALGRPGVPAAILARYGP